MHKTLNVLLGIVAAVLAICAIAMAAFMFLFDPNVLRGPITSRVKAATGRDLGIGDIKVSIYPVLGASLKQVTLSNAPGFGQAPFASVGEVGVGLRILPLLLHRQVQIRSAYLVDPQLNLVENADGANNWSDLAQANAQAAPQAPPPPGSPPDTAPQPIDIGGLDIRNASLNFEDKAKNQTYIVNALNVTSGAIKGGEPFSLSLNGNAQTNEPPMSARITLSAKLTVDIPAKRFQAEDLKLNVDPSGGPLGRGSIDVAASTLAVDRSQGTFKLSDGRIKAGVLDAALSLDGSGIGSDAMHIAGPLAIKPFSPRELMSGFGLEAPRSRDAQALRNFELAANVDMNAKSFALNALKGKLDGTEFSGSFAVSDLATQAVKFALSANQLDVDAYLPADAKPEAETPPENGARPNNSDLDRAGVPLDRLNALNAAGTLDFGALTLRGLKLSAVHVDLDAPRDHTKRVALSAKAYGGDIVSSTEAVPGAPPTYALHMKLQGVSIGPLLKDFAGREPIDGTGDFSVDLSAAAKTVGEMRRQLAGKLAFNFHDGALRGFNGGNMAKQAQALRALIGDGGGGLGATGGDQKTEFARLSGTGTISNGVLHNSDLAGVGPMFNIAGSGELDLVRKTIDYLIKLTVVSSGQSVGNFDLSRLDGLVLPVHISGPFSNPQRTVDLRSAIQQKAFDRLRGRLGGAPADPNAPASSDPRAQMRERLRERLGNFLNNRQPPPSNPPANPPP